MSLWKKIEKIRKPFTKRNIVRACKAQIKVDFYRCIVFRYHHPMGGGGVRQRLGPKRIRIVLSSSHHRIIRINSVLLLFRCGCDDCNGVGQGWQTLVNFLSSFQSLTKSKNPQCSPLNYLQVYKIRGTKKKKN